ncbi:DUF4936 family protein [Limnobacter sp.]|uniref:DUF4936 family protein n=1 Tax=Limnobacter sp. TaxID=2003368 RepID=UPI002585D7D2|nr:DUF4936 family protein [Limnobacter sp.]
MKVSYALYVYYKVNPAALANACVQSKKIMQQMANQTGAATRLMRRADEGGKPVITLMEIYEFAEGNPFEAQARLDQIVQVELGEKPECDRHTELFVLQADA